MLQYAYFTGRYAGMFSNILIMMGILKAYEEGRYTGVDIDLHGGEYWESTVAGNTSNGWLTYYFDPITVGVINTTRYQPSEIDEGRYAFAIEDHTSREHAHQLIERYIHLNTKTQETLDTFYNTNIRDAGVFSMIGVHYRGTDKAREAALPSYASVGDHIARNLLNLQSKIYVATDEQAFLDYMRSRFGDAVIAYPKCYRSRSKMPTHHHTHLHRQQHDADDEWKSPYHLGMCAVIDAYMLARCHLLLRTSSNLSLFSTFLQPNMDVIELSKRHGR